MLPRPGAGVTLAPPTTTDTHAQTYATIHTDAHTRPHPHMPAQPPRYRTSVEDVPVGDFSLPLGQAAVLREGSDITLIGWGAQVRQRGGFEVWGGLLGEWQVTQGAGGGGSQVSSIRRVGFVGSAVCQVGHVRSAQPVARVGSLMKQRVCIHSPVTHNTLLSLRLTPPCLHQHHTCAGAHPQPGRISSSGL